MTVSSTLLFENMWHGGCRKCRNVNTMEEIEW